MFEMSVYVLILYMGYIVGLMIIEFKCICILFLVDLFLD